MRRSLALVALVCALGLGGVVDGQGPTVQTRQGLLTGTYYTLPSRTEFRSIPFAKPPVNDLRWKAPVYPPSNYTEGKRDASGGVPLMCCSQVVSAGSQYNAVCTGGIVEDCLYLNVFVPGELNATAKLPVMVWVHGGSFTSGAAALYNATLLSSSYNVIVVTINYRLNIFGFLGSQELIDEAGKSGINFGIQDTATALQWVQDNIAGFGGDTKSVTVFGESAGAIDIAWILSNPKYEGLFNRAILESGAGGTLEAQAVVSAYGTGIFNGALSYFNISTNDTAKSKLEKLRKIPASNITGYYVASKSTFAYPVIDNVSVLDKSLRVLASGKFVKKLDGILLGTNTNEGSVFALALNYTTASDLRKQLSALDAAAPGLDAQVWYSEWDQIQADVYIGNGTGNFTAEFEANSNYITDSGFVVPMRKLAQAYVDAGVPVYSYRFDVISNATLQNYRALYARGYYMGVTHGSEIPFVFSFVPTLSGQAEVNTSRQMASSWTQFARTANPSNPLVGTWPKYTTPARDIMYFGANGTVSVKQQGSLPDFRQQGQAFLEQYLEVSSNVPRPPLSLDGRCGPSAGTRCPSYGQCCSIYGWCGNGTDFCGRGCQSRWSYVSVSCG